MSPSLLNDTFCNKTLLLHSASNISETIRCARYLRGINCLNTPTVIEDVYGLGNVFSMINPGVSIVSESNYLNNVIDIEYDLSKLGYFIKDINCDLGLTSYITIPNRLKEESTSIIGEVSNPKIGLCLSQYENSNPLKHLNFLNSLTIQQTIKAHYFSFIASQDESIKSHSRVDYREFQYHEQNYDVIASLIAEMDIVISFDNVIAHLAGALARPIFLLVPFYEDSITVEKFIASYPYVTIFRQQYPDDWTHIFMQIALLRRLNLKYSHYKFEPFNVLNTSVKNNDSNPLPNISIETTSDLLKLLDTDIEKISNVTIETTTICNLSCHYCPNSNIGREQAFMKESTFYKIIDSLKEYDNSYAGSICPHFYGEPLLDKRLESFVMYIKNIHPLSIVKIFTNGELLSIERYNSLKKAGVKKFVISQHTDQPSIYLADLLKFLDKNPSLVEDIEYHKMNTKKAMFNRGGLVETEPLSVEALSKVSNCVGAYNHMSFDYNGNAVFCCQDYLSKYTYGNINNQTISNIWNNNEYSRTRKLIQYGFLPLNICRICVYGNPS